MKESLKIKIAIILTLIGVSSIIIGTTFAIYENTINAGKSQIIKTGIVNFTLTESTNGLVLDNLQELIDYDGMAQEEYYEFTIKNTGSTITDYEISLVDKTSTSYTGTILNDKYVKVGLLKNNSEEIIVNLEETNRLLDKVTLDVDESVNYKLRLWLDFGNLEDEAKEALVGQKIFLALKINGIQNVNPTKVNGVGAKVLTTLTNNVGDSGLYTITHAADSTLQIGTNEDITEYRYRGASPKNYVTFNNEAWRIIGVFPTDDGTGKIENRIKLIRSESIGTNKWNTKNSDDWTSSSLKTELNGTYLNGFNDDKNMISNVKYYLGYGDYPKAEAFYKSERTIIKSTKTNSPVSWTGKIGLMYVSDYGYAASEECDAIDLSELDPAHKCNSLNWLYFDEAWFINPYGEDSGDNYCAIRLIGYIPSYQVIVLEVTNSGNIFPTLYLTSSVQITGGTGTSTDPYTLGL
mgnify:CR=1 FL=1